MQPLSNKQLFTLALVSLVIIAVFTYLDQAFIPTTFGLLVGIVAVVLHMSGGVSGAANVIQGVNLAVPLAPIQPPAPLPLPALESVPTLPTPAPAVGVSG
jgi:hypothetical protein